MSEIFKSTKCGDEDELLNVQHPIYDADLLDHDYRCDSLEEDVFSLEDKVDCLTKIMRQVIQKSGLASSASSEILGNEKSRKVLGIKPSKISKRTPVTIVFDHSSITINLPDGWTGRGSGNK